MEKSVERFQKEFEVHYYEVNFRQELTVLALLNYLEETAIAHSEAVGYGVTRLQEQGYGWILNQWQLQMEQFPRRGEKITIQTWPSRFERFYGEREFLVRNEQDAIIARASSLWIFFHLQKRRPVRIPPEIGEAYSLFPEKGVSDSFPEWDQSMMREIEHQEFMIRRSDIDTNHHVNNAKYVEWMLETVPEDVYRSYRLDSLEVAYKKECTYGQIITACTCTEEETRTEQKAQYVHRISENKEGQPLALARTRWSKTAPVTN